MDYGIFADEITKKHFDNLARHLSLGDRHAFVKLLVEKFQMLPKGGFLTRDDIDAIFDTNFYNAI